MLINGSAFVRRFSSFLSHSNIYFHNLGLHDVGEIALFGVGGRTIAKVEKFDLGFVRARKPDIVILELGTNDLTKFPPESVGSSLEELVELLYENCSVKVIGVCQVMAIFKTRNEEWEWGTGNGESLKRGIFKSGNL